jgi:hypothetical protein
MNKSPVTSSGTTSDLRVRAVVALAQVATHLFLLVAVALNGKQSEEKLVEVNDIEIGRVPRIINWSSP